MTLHRRLATGRRRAVTLARAAVAAQAQTVMKLASATINDGQHEWQKLFVEGAARRRSATRSRPKSIRRASSARFRAWPRACRSAPSSPSSRRPSFVTNLDPRFQIFDVPGLFRLARAPICGDPGSELSRSSGDHVPRQGPARDRRDLQQPDRDPAEEAGADARGHQGHEGAHLRIAPAGRADEVDRRDPGAARAVRGDPAASVRRPRRHAGRHADPDRVQVLRRRQIRHRPAILLHPVGQSREREPGSRRSRRTCRTRSAPPAARPSRRRSPGCSTTTRSRTRPGSPTRAKS